MRSARWMAAGSLWCGLAAACVIDDIDYTGKGCSLEAPCPEGFVCVGGSCTPATAAQECSPRFTVSGFRRLWETPHTVRWTWVPKGSASDFVQYKLVLATSAQGLEEARQRALAGEDDGPGGSIWTRAENPELAEYELRLSGGTDIIDATTTDGLTPGTEYRAQLLAYDAAGCVHTSEAAVAVTREASAFGHAIFEDGADSVGDPRPLSAQVETDAARAFEGERFISWAGWPDDGSVAAGTWENVGLWAIASDPGSDYPLLDFSAAYLELALAIDGTPLAAWGEARLLLGPSPGVCQGSSLALIAGYVFRPGGQYHVLELPLGHFELKEGGLLDAAMLASSSICEVSVGRGWALGESVRVDAIRLRW